MNVSFLSSILIFIFFGISQNVISKSVNIQKVWVTSDNPGYTVHSKFDIIGMKGKKIRVIATFYDNNKKLMKMVRQEYRNANNGVAISNFTTPPYDESSYQDYQLYIPSDALRLTYGLNTCYVNISVYDETEKRFIGYPSSFTAFYPYYSPHGSQSQLSKNNTTSSSNNKRRGFRLRDSFKSSETKNLESTKVSSKNNTTSSSDRKTRGFSLNNLTNANDNKKPKTTRWNDGNGGYTERTENPDGSIHEVTKMKCWDCHGNGICRHCHGTGHINTGVEFTNCFICYGTLKCTICYGSGYMTYVTRTVNGVATMYDNRGKVTTLGNNNSSTYSSGSSAGNNSSSAGYNSNNINCGICKGSGRCTLCAGKGWKRLNENSPQVDCPDCLGGGQCRWCFGTGKYKDPVYVPIR